MSDTQPRPTLTNRLGTIASKLFVTTSAMQFSDLLKEFTAEVRNQALAEGAAAEEGLRARLWLIEQALAPIDVQQDPAGIVGMVGPLLNGPLHPTDLAEYRAARGTQEG